MDRGYFAWGCIGFLALAGASGGALAQTGPSPPGAAPAPALAPDPAYEAARLAFEALPEADRKAVQDGLIWTGDYNSVVNGVFGKRTLVGINAYAKANKLPVNGTLDAKARAALAAAAAKAKLEAKFAVVLEPRSGVRIGIPAALLPKSANTPTGKRYEMDGGLGSLETFAPAGAEADLAKLFELMKVDGSGRKVTYKLLKPDFFVVSGEVNGHSYYTRMASGMHAGARILRGFTFSYDSSLKFDMERISLAIANSFEPFAPGEAVQPLAAGAPALPLAAPAGPAAIVATPAKPVLSATGLAISATQVLAALPLAGCASPLVGKAPARVLKADKETGLTLLEARGTALLALAPGGNAAGEVVVIFFDAAGSQQATPGEIFDAGTPRLRAALQGGHSGGVAFERTGSFAGLVMPPAGNAPATYGLIGANTALAFAGPAVTSVVAGQKSTGEIVAAVQSAIVPVSCTK